MGYPDTVSGFAVIPAIYSKDATHILYGKAHTGSKKTDSKALPNGRTLFLVNVPPDATERELSLFFKPAGVVEKVVFDLTAQEETLNAESDSDEEEDSDEGTEMQVDGMADGRRPSKRRRKNKEEKPIVKPLPSISLRTLRKTGRTAYVVFLDPSSLSNALSPPYKSRPWPRSDGPSGLARYKALYDSLRPPLDAVREHAESSIALYDHQEAQKKQRAQYRKGEAIVDEDGFTLVTRGGAYGQTLGGGVAVTSKRFQETGETKRGRRKRHDAKEKDGFYAFQKHEKKRKELVELRNKWKEDVEKVEKLKATKRFKPY